MSNITTRNVPSESPLVAVFMPNYNGAAYIAEAMESVCTQTYTNILLLVGDDASADESCSIINKYAEKDSRIKVYIHTKNQGAAAMRNTLLENVPEDTSYIALLDSDDVAEPERIAKQISFLEQHSKIDMVTSNIHLIDAMSESIGTRDYPQQHDAIREEMLVRNTIAQSSVCARKKVFDTVGLYDVGLKRVEDLDYWARVLRHGFRVETIQAYLVRYRIHRSLGVWGRSRKDLWYSTRVRTRYIFSSDLFSWRAVVVTIGYMIALFLPQRVVSLAHKVLIKSYET